MCLDFANGTNLQFREMLKHLSMNFSWSWSRSCIKSKFRRSKEYKDRLPYFDFEQILLQNVCWHLIWYFSSRIDLKFMTNFWDAYCINSSHRESFEHSIFWNKMRCHNPHHPKLMLWPKKIVKNFKFYYQKIDKNNCSKKNLE